MSTTTRSRTTPRISSPVIALVTGASLLLASIIVATSSLAGPASPARQPDAQAVHLETDRQEIKIRVAVSTFLWALSNRHAAGVWHFTDEDHQIELETEAAALLFFSRIHPQLTHSRQMTFDAVGFDETGAHATFYVKDIKGNQWFAWFAVEQDAVGDWKIVNCRVRLAPGQLA